MARLAVPHRVSQIARCASQLRIAEPKSQETCHAVSNASHASLLTSPHRRDFSQSRSHRKKKSIKKHSNFIEILKTCVKMKTKTDLGKVRGVRSYFTDPCKNHIKACQKASRSFFTILDSYHQITVKSKQNCNKNTHLRNGTLERNSFKTW